MFSQESEAKVPEIGPGKNKKESDGKNMKNKWSYMEFNSKENIFSGDVYGYAKAVGRRARIEKS